MSEPEDLKLIRSIVRQGGKKYTGGNIDRHKYRRLVELGWLKGTPINLSDVVYEVTPAGNEIAAAGVAEANE
jgi:hypothetical protein